VAYYDVFLLTQDSDFQGRVAACYATEEGQENPNAWTFEHLWVLAAEPGFGDAYASALASGNERPGKDPAVITDGMILSAVQAEMDVPPPPPPPEDDGAA
jgi:hypothetical protein